MAERRVSSKISEEIAEAAPPSYHIERARCGAGLGTRQAIAWWVSSWTGLCSATVVGCCVAHCPSRWNRDELNYANVDICDEEAFCGEINDLSTVVPHGDLFAVECDVRVVSRFLRLCDSDELVDLQVE